MLDKIYWQFVFISKERNGSVRVSIADIHIASRKR